MRTDEPQLRAAYAECTAIAKAHYENFPVGSLLVPKRIRPHFHAIYAFMRSADDFADLPHRPKEDRLRLLADWRRSFAEVSSGNIPTNPIFIALQDTVRKFDLPQGLLTALLDAFDFDANGDVKFETYEELHWYTRRSAEPVGQLVLALFGYQDAERIAWSNDICTALQIINFMQDAGEDLANDRCYFPREDYLKYGIHSAAEIVTSTRAGDLVLFECQRIKQLLENGKRLPKSVHGRLKFELRGVLQGAWAMVRKIEEARGDTISNRPKLTSSERRAILWRALLPSGD